MISVIQRVRSARVEVAGDIVGAIDQGLLVLVGVEPQDTPAAADKLLHKLLNYRVFSDQPEFSCQYQTVNSTFTCPTGHFWEGTEVRLTTTGPSGAVFAGWSGDCHSPVGEPRVAIAQMGGNRSCTATWQQ